LISAKKLATNLLFLEALISLTWTIYLIVAPIFSEVTSQVGLILDVLYYVIFTSTLWFCARGFKNGKRYVQAPALLINLILLGVSYFMVIEKVLWLAIPIGYLLAVLSIAVLISIFLVIKDSNKPNSHSK
jgi:F0F1-type ATP synthase assembly protein I